MQDPQRYGVAKFAADDCVEAIIEKPSDPPSNFAITGLYFLDESAPTRAASIKPSPRGELEITCLLNSYIAENALHLRKMGRGFAWLDTGTHASLLEAGNFVRSLETRQGLQAGCPEEIAYEKAWIDRGKLGKLAQQYSKNAYGEYLQNLLNTAA